MSIGAKKLRKNRKMKCKVTPKGQVTVFVILGIVILVVVIIAMSGISTITKIKLQQDASNAVNNYLASESINYYVYTCMDAAVTSSIDDLSLQGGTFYTYQGGPNNISRPNTIGTIYIPYSLNFTSTNGSVRTLRFNVSYSVLNNSYCNIVNLNVPEYPNKSNQYISELYPLYENTGSCLLNFNEGYRLSGFAGYNNMSRLCYMGSENTKPIGTPGSTSLMFSPCIPNNNMMNVISANAKNQSVEYLLQSQISKRLKNCVDFSIFENAQGDNITILNDPVTKVILTTEGISVESIYNFTVSIKNKQPVLVKHLFKYDSKLRIVRMHNYVMALLKADSKDFLFNLSKDYASYANHLELGGEISDYYDPEHMSVQVVGFENDSTCTWPLCQYKYDHLLIVKDNASLIGNRSLTYITALKNRIPALDFIHQTDAPNYYDIIASNNQTIVIDPWGYDPDDQNVWYIYNGWKEDYDDNCTLPSINGNTGQNILCKQIVMSPALAPHNWSNSGMFLQTHRMANYTTNVSDYGPHNVTLTVKDESGLFDYQVVKILVFDLPVANISKIKIYNDIPENIASVEDMLPLDGSASRGSIIMGGSITNYIWTIFWWNAAIPDWQSVFYNKSSNPLITIPTEFSTIITDKNILIQKIKPLNLSNVGIHNVTLVVESNIPLTNQPVYSVPVGVGVNVTECVPHHNTTLIYPYNAVTTDPFTANHTCCTGTTGSLLDQATVFKRKTTFDICYMTSLYGELEKLRTQSTNPTLTKISELANYQYTFSLTQSPPPGVFPTGGKYNDVYNLTFDRNCDGNRGNICAGPMFATYTVLWPCTAKGTLNEACTGPDQITNIAPAGCTKYGFGTTFEKTFNPSTGTGICNTARTCSTPGVGGYGASTGKAYCQGTCDGSGVCAGAWNCLCSKSACGAAQCDAAYSFEWAVGSTMCKSNCNLNPTLSNMCSFGSSNQIYCTPPSNNYQGTVGCLSGEYCRISHCDANGGGALQGDKCVKGETFPGTGAQAGKTCCIYWPSQIPPSPLCTSAGICNFNKDCRANVTGLSCNPSSGWT